MKLPPETAAVLSLLGALLAACMPAATPAATPGKVAPPSAASMGTQSRTVEEIASLPLGPERQRILEEGARREGQFTLYTSSTGLEPVAELFMRQYPFLTTEVLASRSEPLTQHTLAEVRAGRLNGDVLKSNLLVYDALKEHLVRFNSPGARFDHAPNAASVDATGIAFAYSKQRVAAADVPQRVEDLLHPRWRQNLGLFAPPNNYPGRWVGALIEHLGEPATREFLRQLGDQRPYFYTQPEAARNGLLAGEWDLNMQGITSAVVSARKGEPIGWVALDPTTLSPTVIGLTSMAPHPYAAMLFLDWAMSAEGQRVFTEAQGSITQEELDRREKEGVRLPTRITIQSPTDAARWPEWMKLFDELVVRK